MTADAVAPGVRRLVAPNPGLMTGPGTNTYLLGERLVAVIDPGPDDPGHLDRIAAEAARLGGRIAWIWLTHAHPDHAAGVGPLMARTGAKLAAWPTANTAYEVAHLPAPTLGLADGEAIAHEGLEYRALHTPGHASDHMCFFRPEDRLLFAGDVVAEQGTVVIAPPDGNLVAYLATLDRLARLAPRLILPGHGEAIGEPVARLEALTAHRLAREAQILEALDGGLGTLDELVRAIYATIDPRLHPIAREQVHGHLLKLGEEGRAAEGSGRWQRV